MPPIHAVRCSRCGSRRDLHVVTQPYSEESAEGRLLVYCPQCLADCKHRLTVHLPVAEVNAERFLELYRLGATSSYPETAAQIVFGEADTSLVRKALVIMEKRNPSDLAP